MDVDPWVVPFYIIKECVLPGSDVGAQLTLRYF